MDLKYILVYLIGFFSCAFLFYGFFYSGVEVPFSTGYVGFNSEAPGDWVSEDDIEVYGNLIVLNVANASISNYAPTGSMRPVLDKGANGIRIVPDREDDIDIGDIVSFRMSGRLIVHRVVDKGVDEQGVYFVTQGDNTVLSDGKIRFKDIEYVTIGVIY